MLIIKTTGLDQYAPGGTARIKILTIGGPGAGKTRWASYFPKPIYADCEDGLASVADRKMPHVSINSSQDMLDMLAFLKQECKQPQDSRTYLTVVIDTLDAFQRKVKNEWMEINRKETFTGWEAWGFLNAKMQLLMTRLLNLDMNVIVNVHFKDKTTKDDETGRETHAFMLQLQGETADTAFNDFDLVGWMGTYWEPVNGERVQKRGLTFKATPDKPFLKDRLHVTPKWLEVTFSDSDYTNLFERLQARAAEISQTETIGEIPSSSEDPNPPAAVVAPGAAGSGALPAQPPRQIPFVQLDKPTLLKRARDLNITTTIDGSPIRGNTLKSELVAALEAATNAAQPAAPTPAPAPPLGTDAGEGPGAATTPVANPDRTRVAGESGSGSTPAASTIQVPEGTVNTATGELLEPAGNSVAEKSATEVTHEQAVATVQKELGGQVIDEDPPTAPAVVAEPPPTQPPPAAAAATPDKWFCEDCGTDLSVEKPDFVKLAWIKYRKRLCQEDYLKRKTQPVR